jgi:hypothetical protein
MATNKLPRSPKGFAWETCSEVVVNGRRLSPSGGEALFHILIPNCMRKAFRQAKRKRRH